MALEIGERRRAEEELRVAEQRYRTLAEHIPAVTYIWQATGTGEGERRDYTSPRIEQMLGYTAQEWHQTPEFWISRLHPDDRRAVIAATLRSEATGEPFSMEYRYLHKDGHIVWVLDEAVLLTRGRDARPHLFQGVMLDITERKEAETRARQTELRYRSLAEQVPGVIYTVDIALDRVTYVSPQVTTVLGLRPEDWATPARWLATVHPDDRERVGAIATRVFQSGEPYAAEYRIVRPDGTVRWVRDQGVVVDRNPAGGPREIQGIVIDVTAQRAGQEAAAGADRTPATIDDTR
jgi:PAS domain S-box-containing protein